MNLIKPIIFASIVFIGIILATQSFYVVNPGYTAIKLRLGRIVNVNSESGIYTKRPFVDNIVMLNTRIKKSSIETTALSKDLQSVSIGITINYRILNALKLYQNLGVNYKRTIIKPFAQETLKAIVSKFTAENLIQRRHEAKELVLLELQERLSPLYLSVIEFNIVFLDFSPDFIKAVERKQIALQQAITAKNLTQKVNEEAIQAMKRSDAEAYALKIKKECATPDLINLKKIETLMIAIEKWDGSLPRIITGGSPLFNMGLSEQLK